MLSLFIDVSDIAQRISCFIDWYGTEIDIALKIVCVVLSALLVLTVYSAIRGGR